MTGGCSDHCSQLTGTLAGAGTWSLPVAPTRDPHRRYFEGPGWCKESEQNKQEPSKVSELRLERLSQVAVSLLEPEVFKESKGDPQAGSCRDGPLHGLLSESLRPDFSLALRHPGRVTLS